MSLNDIYLGPSGNETLLSAAGRKFSRSPIEIAREDRTASGRAVKDIVALKWKFTLQYELIDNADLVTLQGLYDLKSALSLKVRKLNNTFDTFTVLLKPFASDRVTAIGTGLWGNVTVELEQV